MTDPYQPGPPDPVPPPPDPQPYGYQPPAYYAPQPMYPYGYVPPRPTEGLAIASLVVSCAGVFGLCLYGVGGLLGIVGAILGHVARRRIARTGADGAALALAGIIVGWCMAAVSAAAVAFFVIVIATESS